MAVTDSDMPAVSRSAKEPSGSGLRVCILPMTPNTARNTTACAGTGSLALPLGPKDVL